MNMPTAAKPAAPASRTSACVGLVDPADRDDRQRRARATPAGARRARQPDARPASRPTETPCRSQIVAAAVGDGRVDLRQRVHRASDEKPGGRSDRREGGNARGRRRVAAQMHAGRAGGDRDVGAIVHDHARAGAAVARDHPAHQRGQRARRADRARAPGSRPRRRAPRAPRARRARRSTSRTGAGR